MRRAEWPGLQPLAGPPGRRDAEHDVPWWSDGRLHAEDTAEALAKAFAWASDNWPDRHLIGTLLDSSPVDRTRVMDHLNRAGRFLRLWATNEHFLINTAQVVAVTELGEAK